MSNVRFYRLSTLPEFAGEKHQGIFVHLTPAKNETHKAGLWFGGATGWEYLTNDTDAINAAIDAKIQALDVNGYAQATISGSTLTISGIKEVDGKIAKDDDQKLVVAIDGTYDSETNKIATQSTVTTAIGTLDVQTPIQAVTFNTPENGGNTVLTFNGIKEENGIISQGTSEGASTFIVGDAKLKIQIGSNEAGVFEVFSANAQSDGAIKLNENVFKKDENNVISVITPTAVSERNRLVTEQDIASLVGAMHYKGAITAGDEFTPDNWPTKVAAGDVYIATNKFQKDGNTIESGDLIVFNSETLTDYKVVQSNITLGTGVGQVATNEESLISGNVVIATSTGIKTIGISEEELTGESQGNNKRDLTYTNGTADKSDATLFHSTTITDTFKVIGKDFSKTINISSNNRSIEIEKNATDNGILVDLVWNTQLD